MSLTHDIRGYADTAIEQGKTVVTTVVTTAVGQAQANVTRATGAVADLRTQAEKTLNVDAIRTAVEPYLAQARTYRASVTDRAEGLLDSVKSDKRVTRVVATAEAVTDTVVTTVTERVVKPVSSLTGRKPATSAPAPKAAPAKTAPAKKAGKPAATRPAAKKTAGTTATKTTAKKTAAKKTAAGSS